MNTGSAIITLATFGALVAMLTKGIDKLRAFDVGDRMPKLFWAAVSVVSGLVVAFGLRLDATALLRDALQGVLSSNGVQGVNVILPKVSPILGRLITGLMLDGAAAYTHSRLSARAAASTNPKGLKVKSAVVITAPIRRKPRPAQPVAPPEPRG